MSFVISIKMLLSFHLSPNVKKYIADGVETLLPKERKLIDLINFNHDYQLSFAVHFYPEKVSQVVQTICVDFIYSEVVKKVNQGVIKLPINILHDLAAISLAVLFPFGDGLGHLPQGEKHALTKSILKRKKNVLTCF